MIGVRFSVELRTFLDYRPLAIFKRANQNIHMLKKIAFAIFVLLGTLIYLSSPAYADWNPQAQIIDIDSDANRKAAPISQWKSGDVDQGTKQAILQRYKHVDPTQKINRVLLDHALVFFELNKMLIPQQQILSVIDFSLHSSQRRFHVVDLRTGRVDSYHTAHGVKSDQDHDGIATEFSNVEGSLQTSLGFLLTAETYFGQHGYSLRLDGVSETTSKARVRAIVVHAADYVKPGLDRMGRSWGCPALPTDVNKRVIDQIRNGSLVLSSHVGLYSASPAP